MNTDVFVEVMRVLEGDAFKAFQVGGEFIEFGETATTLLLNTNFDFANPSPLKFDTLSNDFLLQAGK